MCGRVFCAQHMFREICVGLTTADKEEITCFLHFECLLWYYLALVFVVHFYVNPNFSFV
jgi:hypothetical protein